ncbi:hypothetical protein ACJX0J_017709, partial [Zea mays]
ETQMTEADKKDKDQPAIIGLLLEAFLLGNMYLQHSQIQQECELDIHKNKKEEKSLNLENLTHNTTKNRGDYVTILPPFQIIRYYQPKKVKV